MQSADKKLKLYYSINEVAGVFGTNEPLLRFWEKEFPQLRSKEGGRGICQYRKEGIEMVKLVYHLAKEHGAASPGTRRRMEDSREATLRNFEAVGWLRSIREELIDIEEVLNVFTYEDVKALKENPMKEHP